MPNKNKSTSRKYSILPYDPNWVNLFLTELLNIHDILGKEILEIHHIGSTAVPGMSAEPTVDMLFVVQDISKIAAYIAAMQGIGYTSLEAKNGEKSLLFEKIADGNRQFIAYFYQKNHYEIIEMLTIRDYLILHQNEAMLYSDFKIYLFKTFPNNYGQYRIQKDEYMNGLKERALEWYENTKK